MAPSAFVVSVVAVLLTGCGTTRRPEPLAPINPDVLLVIVGGNSEFTHKQGMRQIYDGHDDAQKSYIVESLAKGPSGAARSVAVRYFSWTGDNEWETSRLPVRPNWIFGGSEYIHEQIQPDFPRAPARIVIAGWSNGAATAYELACKLTASHREEVSLLVTLDPVAWTTRTCTATDGAPRKPAATWINVYTKSSPVNRFKVPGNWFAFFGSAWNATFPREKAARGDFDERWPSTNHGDVARMWKEAVEPSNEFKQWRSTSR
jgi:hypothetical protein